MAELPAPSSSSQLKHESVTTNLINSTLWFTTWMWENITFQDTETTEFFDLNETTAYIVLPDKAAYVPARIILSILMGLVIILTLVGNFLVFLAIGKNRGLHRINNGLILSLAASDFSQALTTMPMFLVCLISEEWILPPNLCPVYHAWHMSAQMVSATNLTAISLERVFIITRPLLYHRVVTRTKMATAILLIWIVGVTYGFLQLLWFDFSSLAVEETGLCTYRPHLAYALFDVFLTCLVPLTVMIIAYARIFCVVQTQMKKIEPKVSNENLSDLSTFQYSSHHNISHFVTQHGKMLSVPSAVDEVSDDPDDSVTFKVGSPDDLESQSGKNNGDLNLQGEHYEDKSQCQFTSDYLTVPAEPMGSLFPPTSRSDTSLSIITQVKKSSDSTDVGQRKFNKSHRLPKSEKGASREKYTSKKQSRKLSAASSSGEITDSAISTDDATGNMRDAVSPSNTTVSSDDSAMYCEAPLARQVVPHYSPEPSTSNLQSALKQPNSTKYRDPMAKRGSVTFHVDERTKYSRRRSNSCPKPTHTEPYNNPVTPSGTTIPKIITSSFLANDNNSQDPMETPSHHQTRVWARQHFNVDHYMPPASPGQHSHHGYANSHTSSTYGGSHSTRRRSATERIKENKAVKMFLIVVGAFMICWTPYEVCFLIEQICGGGCISVLTWYIINTLVYISSAVNPFIYNFYSKEFRHAVKHVLTCSTHKHITPWMS